MKILFVADLHYALKQFDWLLAHAASFELVIIGGDLLDISGPLDLEVQIVVIEKYLARLRQCTRVLVSSGNHDGDDRSPADESVCRWLREAKADRLFVDGDSVMLGDTLITICPWWDGPASRAELQSLLEREAGVPKTRWIWIHHAPPDQSPVSWAGKRFGGDVHLVDWIRRFQPDIVLSGHIHNAPFVAKGSWVDRLGRTWAFNPGRQIGPQPAYLAFDLERPQVEWVSLEGRVLRQLELPVTDPVPAGVNAAAGA